MRNRNIQPHALFCYDGSWYVRAFCELRNSWRSLAIHRITGIELSPETFVRDPAAINDVRRGWIFEKHFTCGVECEVSADKARVVSEREWFGPQTVTPCDHGSTAIVIERVPTRAFVDWVLSFHGHVMVTKPTDLRQKVHEAAQAVAARHSR